MPVQKLIHYSVRTRDLPASRAFFIDILGLVEGYRPPFDFPGAWLYRGGDEDEYGVVHLIGVDDAQAQGLDAYLGQKDEQSLHGSAAIDHVAFSAVGLAAMRQTLKEANWAFRERHVPKLHLHQLFIEDPSGVTIELNFPASESADEIHESGEGTL